MKNNSEYSAYEADKKAFTKLDPRESERTEMLYHTRQIHRLLSLLVFKEKTLWNTKIHDNDSIGIGHVGPSKLIDIQGNVGIASSKPDPKHKLEVHGLIERLEKESKPKVTKKRNVKAKTK